MSKLQWYWHRLRAMERGEVAAHVRKKFHQWQDARRLPDWSGLKLEPAASSFPRLLKPEEAPAVLREALARDTKEILAGQWKAFGHLEIQVDDPPQWHKDYLVGKNLATTEVVFKLDHRELPDGADIKLIWELSRWYQLVRLAMAAYVLGDERAATKCVEWLEDWVKHNPPYRGWNWTSALEVGMRLVQFTWIDALLRAQAEACGYSGRIARLRQEILPAHVWFAWRYRSFGSSANNHIIGELAGLILTIARWPELSRWAAPLSTLQMLWEREVLAQFAEDGGNREQALNYHLFSWEFCWQARAGLIGAKRNISAEVDERLRRAARFYWELQVRREPWDYGDSDNATVTPLFTREQSALIEWRDWLSRAVSNAGVSRHYWIGDPPELHPPLGKGEPQHIRKADDWWFYPDTGMAICESGFWFLRWDLSPLGYLKTAAHGHLDALHLSIWYNGVAMVIDPGTGAYYADKDLRTWLASRGAHNGPCPLEMGCSKRSGSFLWAQRHLAPVISRNGRQWVGVMSLPDCATSRFVEWSKDGQTWTAVDICQSTQRIANVPFSVRWQFAPDAIIRRLSERSFAVSHQSVVVEVQPGEQWTEVKLVEAPADRQKLEPESPMAGIVSPAFRKTVFAPYLLLVARPPGNQPCVFRTTFLASRDS